MERKKKPSATQVVKEIKRRTRRIYSAEEKIRIVLEGFRGEESLAAICRKYDIHANTFYTRTVVCKCKKTNSTHWHLLK